MDSRNVVTSSFELRRPFGRMILYSWINSWKKGKEINIKMYIHVPELSHVLSHHLTTHKLLKIHPEKHVLTRMFVLHWFVCHVNAEIYTSMVPELCLNLWFYLKSEPIVVARLSYFDGGQHSSVSQLPKD